MSTDFHVVCDRCKLQRHLGSVGGSGRIPEPSAVMEFVNRHYNCSAKPDGSHGVRVALQDCLAGDPSTDYAEDDGEWPARVEGTTGGG